IDVGEIDRHTGPVVERERDPHAVDPLHRACEPLLGLSDRDRRHDDREEDGGGRQARTFSLTSTSHDRLRRNTSYGPILTSKCSVASSLSLVQPHHSTDREPGREMLKSTGTTAFT